MVVDGNFKGTRGLADIAVGLPKSVACRHDRDNSVYWTLVHNPSCEDLAGNGWRTALNLRLSAIPVIEPHTATQVLTMICGVMICIPYEL